MKDIVQQAVTRFTQCQTAVATERIAAREDLMFVAGNQWASTSPTSDDYRVSINLLGPFLRQITAEARSANPAIRVVPVATQADVDTADVISGLIRHIEQRSNAEGVYQQALWYSAAAGAGYILLDSEYVSDDSFDQDLVINAIDNPEKVFLDPRHTRKDGSDIEYAFIVEDMDADSFKSKFASSATAELLQTNSWNLLTLPNDWISKDTVRVAKYYVKEYKMQTVYLIQDPITLQTSSVTEKPGDDVIVLKKRRSNACTVKAYLLTAYEVLEETTWPGQYIPIVKVTGESFYVGGQVHQQGAIRQAKSAQRLYNFFTSRQFEMVDQAPKNSWVITEKQLGNNADRWANANRVNYGFLPYVKEDGSPPPSRVSGLDQGNFMGISQAKSEALEAIKLVFGLNDASLGAPGNEISGAAISARVEQSSRSTYQYFDHLLLSMKQLGRCIVDVLPSFYDTDRVIRIVKPTDEEELVYINSMSNNNRYDLTRQGYDVVVTTGPAYASKRQEAHDALAGILQTVPTAPIGDLVASQVDNPVAKLAAARIKATLPPEVLAATGEDNQDNMAPKELVTKLQTQLAQMQMEFKKGELEREELKLQNTQLKDKTALELTKADLEDQFRQHQMLLDTEKVKVEAQLKRMELELKSKQLELAERELEIKATMAAHTVNEAGIKAHNESVNVSIPDVNIDSGISGGLDTE